MSSKERYDAKGAEKIQCLECDGWYHRLDVHVPRIHKFTLEEYKAKYLDAPTISAAALERAGEKVPKKMPRRQKLGPTPPKAEKFVEKGKGPRVFKIGVARLCERTDTTETEKALVPKHDSGWLPGPREISQWEHMATAIEDREPCFAHGPTGCGKSTGILELAAAIGQPVLRVQLSRDFRVSNFLGRPSLLVDEETGQQVTRWIDGVLPQAMRGGWWLLLDEIDQAHADVLMAIQAVLEGNSLVLAENFGEVVEPAEHFRIFATANTRGRGDETGHYAGAKIMNEATLDRFGTVIKCDYPDRETEAQILVGRTKIPSETAKRMVEVATKVRAAADHDECLATFSTRRLISWARKTQRYGDARKAAIVTVLDKLSGDDRLFVNNLIQRYFGGEV